MTCSFGTTPSPRSALARRFRRSTKARHVSVRSPSITAGASGVRWAWAASRSMAGYLTVALPFGGREDTIGGAPKPGEAPHGIRVLQEDQDVPGAARRLHEQVHLPERVGLQGAARHRADSLAGPADHGGA